MRFAIILTRSVSIAIPPGFLSVAAFVLAAAELSRIMTFGGPAAEPSAGPEGAR